MITRYGRDIETNPPTSLFIAASRAIQMSAGSLAWKGSRTRKGKGMERKMERKKK
jgi:hypothetical protein